MWSPDTLQHVPTSRHVAVLYKGYFYVFDMITSTGHRLTALECERQLKAIVKDRETAPEPGVSGLQLLRTDDRCLFTHFTALLPALTADRRDTWATFRAKHLGDRKNRAALDAIKRSVSCIYLGR